MKRVLVIDDEAPVARLIDTALMLVGVEHTLDYCSDGAQGRLKAVQGEYDLITLDLNMPLMDGMEALAEMKRNPRSRGIPVIVLTARQDPGLRQLVTDLGAAALLYKPFSADALGPVLQSALQGPSATAPGAGEGILRPLGTE